MNENPTSSPADTPERLLLEFQNESDELERRLRSSGYPTQLARDAVASAGDKWIDAILVGVAAVMPPSVRRAWRWTVARRDAATLCRRARFVPLAAEQAVIDTSWLGVRERNLVAVAVAALSAEARGVVTLIDLDGLSGRSAAAACGLSRRRVARLRAQAHRALARYIAERS